MNIAIHSNQLDGRGSGKALYDYAIGLESIGHNVSFITSNLSKNEGINKFKEKFKTSTYDKKVDIHQPSAIVPFLEFFIDENKIDFMYMLKSSENDNVTPSNCKTGIHCVFSMREHHGNVYAGVSEYLAKKFNQSLYVPHIIKNYEPTVNVRKEMDISDDTLIIGRIGGMDSFDLPFVHEAIKQVLNTRKDVIFFFISTNQFYYHEKLLHIPWVETEEEKFNIIHACDVMIHGRNMGETFGLACAEFSVANKPVITWSGNTNPYYDKCHIELLGDKVIIYNNGPHLIEIFRNLNRKDIQNKNWDTYSTRFSEQSVIAQFDKVFLK